MVFLTEDKRSLQIDQLKKFFRIAKVLVKYCKEKLKMFLGIFC